jgi:hypothetical protein
MHPRTGLCGKREVKRKIVLNREDIHFKPHGFRNLAGVLPNACRKAAERRQASDHRQGGFDFGALQFPFHQHQGLPFQGQEKKSVLGSPGEVEKVHFLCHEQGLDAFPAHTGPNPEDSGLNFLGRSEQEAVRPAVGFKPVSYPGRMVHLMQACPEDRRRPL